MYRSTRTLKMLFFFWPAYSANLGGCVTLTGTPPNLVYAGIIRMSYVRHTCVYATAYVFVFSDRHASEPRVCRQMPILTSSLRPHTLIA